MRRTMILAATAAALGLAAVGAVAAQGWGMGPGHGMRGGGLGPRLMELMDADKDGKVTPAEAEAFRKQQLATWDKDGDGALSLAEFEPMHAALTRPVTVDRFQHLDDDGDGAVTEAEMAAPFERMLRRMDRDGDGAIGPGDRGGRWDRGDRGDRGPRSSQP